MADETIRDVVVKVKLDTSEAKRQAASAPGGGGGSGPGGGGDYWKRSEALRQRTEESRELARQRKAELDEEAKAAKQRANMIVGINRLFDRQRTQNIQGFIAERKEEEKAMRARAAAAAAEQAAQRNIMAQQRQQIERYSRLAEAVGNVGRSMVFLGAAGQESLEKIVQTLLVTESVIRGVKGAMQIGQVVREFGQQAAMGAAGGAAGVAAGRFAGGAIGGTAAGATGGAIVGRIGAAGSRAATAYAAYRGAAFALPALGGVAVAGGLGAAVVGGVGMAFLDTERERLAKAQIEEDLIKSKFRTRHRTPGALNLGAEGVDDDLRQAIIRDRNIRDARDRRTRQAFAEGPFDAFREESRRNQFRPVGFEDLNVRQQQGLRSQEIRAARQDLGRVRAAFVEDAGAGAAQQNIDRQVSGQREILALMRQQSSVARQLRDDAVARTRAVAEEINQERGRRNDLRAFAGGLQAPQRAVLQQLNAKAARGDKFTDADFQLLDQVAGGQDFAEKFKRRQFIDRIPEKDLPGLVGGFLGVGEKIGGPQDQIKKLVEDQKVAADKMIQAVQEQTKAQEAETKEIADLMNIMRQSVEIRRQLINQQARDEAEQLQREREAAAARKAAAN